MGMMSLHGIAVSSAWSEKWRFGIWKFNMKSKKTLLENQQNICSKLRGNSHITVWNSRDIFRLEAGHQFLPILDLGIQNFIVRVWLFRGAIMSRVVIVVDAPRALVIENVCRFRRPGQLFLARRRFSGYMRPDGGRVADFYGPFFPDLSTSLHHLPLSIPIIVDLSFSFPAFLRARDAVVRLRKEKRKRGVGKSAAILSLQFYVVQVDDFKVDAYVVVIGDSRRSSHGRFTRGGFRGILFATVGSYGFLRLGFFGRFASVSSTSLFSCCSWIN